jgi:hypothetical protein
MTTQHQHGNGNGHAHPQAAAQMAEAASRFLESLSPQQKAKATYEYLDGERIFWYYPPLNRHGLPLRDMDESQRKLAYAVMESGLTPRAYKQAVQIIDHEVILGEIEKAAGMITFKRDPELYYFTVFGEPGSTETPWGWRVEGHHVSLHFSIWGDKVISTTPFFFGSNPAEVRSGPQKGLRILADRQDLALELVNSFDSSQKSRAIIYDDAPWDILNYNSSRPVFAKEEGLPASRMNGTQREMLMTLITEYVSTVREDVAQDKLAAIREQGLDGFHLAWAGGTQKTDKHYYRIHGGNFVVEYDNRQNEANHIHSVLRDVDNDFANDVLREHLLLYHVL